MAIAIEISVGCAIAIAIITKGFYLPHWQCTADHTTECIVGPTGRASLCISLGEFIVVKRFSGYFSTKTEFVI